MGDLLPKGQDKLMFKIVKEVTARGSGMTCTAHQAGSRRATWPTERHGKLAWTFAVGLLAAGKLGLHV